MNWWEELGLGNGLRCSCLVPLKWVLQSGPEAQMTSWRVVPKAAAWSMRWRGMEETAQKMPLKLLP